MRYIAAALVGAALLCSLTAGLCNDDVITVKEYTQSATPVTFTVPCNDLSDTSFGLSVDGYEPGFNGGHLNIDIKTTQQGDLLDSYGLTEVSLADCSAGGTASEISSKTLTTAGSPSGGEQKFALEIPSHRAPIDGTLNVLVTAPKCPITTSNPVGVLVELTVTSGNDPDTPGSNGPGFFTPEVIGIIVVILVSVCLCFGCVAMVRSIGRGRQQKYAGAIMDNRVQQSQKMGKAAYYAQMGSDRYPGGVQGSSKGSRRGNGSMKGSSKGSFREGGSIKGSSKGSRRGSDRGSQGSRKGGSRRGKGSNGSKGGRSLFRNMTNDETAVLQQEQALRAKFTVTHGANGAILEQTIGGTGPFPPGFYEPKYFSVDELKFPRKKSAPSSFTIDYGLVVINERELLGTIAHLKPYPGESSIITIDNPTMERPYYIASISKQRVALYQSEMGSIAAQMAVTAMVRDFSPVGIINVGVAFGKNKAHQKLGDILVSSEVIPYEMARVGRNEAHDENRAKRISANSMAKFMTDRKHNWHQKHPNGEPVSVIEGPVLSGDKLVDNVDFKTELFEKFPDAVGGEMEGVGVAAGAIPTNTEWVVCKGIVDWADGTKAKDWQPWVAYMATDFVCHVLETLDKPGRKKRGFWRKK